MNTVHNTLAALLLTAISCPAALVAQAEKTDPAGAVPVADIAPVLHDQDHRQAGAERIREEYKMSLSIEQGTLRVRGGQAGGNCAIIVGLQATEFYLPGNAKLSVLPLAILTTGQFNADGELSYSLPLDAAAAGTMVMFQAISVEEGAANFMTSNPWTEVFGDDRDDRDDRQDDGTEAAARNNSRKPGDRHPGEADPVGTLPADDER